MGLLQKLFGSKEKRLSKTSYWKKWELSELFVDLHGARQLLISRQHKADSELENFKAKFVEELGDVEGENIADFTRIWKWFSPNNEWDQIVGIEGNELRKRIFQRADRWKRNREFVPGTKVSLQGEFGVVLDKTDESNFTGFIRWDTEKENDVEHWGGLFGTFLQSGGEVVDQDYKFKYIDEKGQLK